MFGKKRQPFNPYEDRADELLYKVWAHARFHLRLHSD